MPSIHVDVRPALDSVGALVDRARMLTPGTTVGGAPEGTAARVEPEAALGPDGGGGGTEADLVRNACAERFAALQACTTEREHTQAYIGLTLCIAQQVCAREATAFVNLKGGKDAAAQDEAATRFGAMEACVARWGQQQEQQQD